MIAGDSIVQILDVDKEIAYEKAISEIFSKYIEKSIENEGVYIFKPIPGSLKIRDIQGWTDVVKISMSHVLQPYSMTEIGTTENGLIKISNEQLIPLYNGKSMIGFHGEVKYHFDIGMMKDSSLHEIISINPLSKIRIDTNQFIVPEFIKQIQIDERETLFSIETKSGFFNANGIHLIADNSTIKKLYK